MTMMKSVMFIFLLLFWNDLLAPSIGSTAAAQCLNADCACPHSRSGSTSAASGVPPHVLQQILANDPKFDNPELEEEAIYRVS
jgi:hypothetical protein